MKRPMLISGITIAIVSIFLILFSKIATAIVIALAVSVFVLFFIKPLKLKKHIILPFICVCAILATAVFSLYNQFFINPILKYDNTTQNIIGKIVTIPEENHGFITFDIKSTAVAEETKSIKIKVSLPENTAKALRLYDVISIENAYLYIPRNNSDKYDVTKFSDGVFLESSADNANVLWKAERTPYYYCLKLKESITDKIDAFSSDATAGILKGMVFGNSKSIDFHTIKAFRNSGIAHLLAVSGLHTSLWCSLLILILKLFNIPEKARNIICIIFLTAFCIVSAFTPSVMRASFMMLILLVAPFFKRRPESLNSLGFAITTLLILNPYIIASASFQLSATATLGVLCASSFEKKIHSKTLEIKHTIARNLIDYICSSLLVSIFAGVFTLPISSYYFNVFSILSPIANLLCVKLAFYGMISGIIGTGLTFFDNNIFRNIAIFIFDVSDAIIRMVITIAKGISNIVFCTIPVQKESLLIAIFLVAVILLVGYILTKTTHKSKIIYITAIISVICIFVNIFIPLLPTKYENILTVVSSGNNTNIVLRSGTHYMYIANNQSEVSADIYDHLPKATSETLDYYIVTYTSYNNLTDIERMGNNTKPKETYVAPSVKYLCDSNKISLPKNTIIGYTGKYILNNKINVEIVDTHRIKYAIIKGNENNIYIHLHGNADFKDAVDTSPGDIFIYCGKIPEKIPDTAKLILLNSNNDIIANSNYKKLKGSGIDFKLTATHGDIKVII